MSFIDIKARARTIIKLAATKTTDNYTIEWLTRDEFGTWEKIAQDYIEKTEAKAKELGWPEAQVNDELAKKIALDALKAQLAHRTKGAKG